MPKRNSTIKIVDGKVVFSKEVLEYFESIRNEKNSEWIDKYFEVLNNEENINAEKYNGHHIIPCFTFKDETHRTRKETEPLADKVEGNIIKLSIYNHILAHYCLWKIFDNYNSKHAIQYIIGKDKELDNLSENQKKLQEFKKNVLKQIKLKMKERKKKKNIECLKKEKKINESVL